jgi:phosphatidylglycerophosphate synthase
LAPPVDAANIFRTSGSATLSLVRLNRVGITGGVIYLALGLLWVGFAQPPAATWALVGWFALVAAVECFIPGEANQVSLARAHLAAPALVYALASMFGPLAVALAVAGLTDLVDGTVARRFDRPSTLGGGLDPIVDGVLLGAVALGLAFGGVVPLWLAIVIIARYLLPAIGGLVLITMHRRPELRHTVSGQVSTSLIIVLVGGICLFRFMNQDVTNVVIGAEIAIPIATLATFVHLGWAARRPVAAPEPG